MRFMMESTNCKDEEGTVMSSESFVKDVGMFH